MNKIHRRPDFFDSGSGRRTMTAGKIPSDQEVLFSIELLTIPQVAEWAKVSTKTIYRWIESGKIPVVKFGDRTYRIPAGAVIEQLKQSGYEYILDVSRNE